MSAQGDAARILRVYCDDIGELATELGGNYARASWWRSDVDGHVYVTAEVRDAAGRAVVSVRERTDDEDGR